MSRTSNTPWSTAPSSPSTKGDRCKGGTQNQAIGRSRGGLTTKIVALVDALGTLVRFVLLPGQHHDSVGVRPLIEGVAFGARLGDKAFDADWLGVEGGFLCVYLPIGMVSAKALPVGEHQP